MVPVVLDAAHHVVKQHKVEPCGYSRQQTVVQLIAGLSEGGVGITLVDLQGKQYPVGNVAESIDEDQFAKVSFPFEQLPAKTDPPDGHIQPVDNVKLVPHQAIVLEPDGPVFQKRLLAADKTVLSGQSGIEGEFFAQGPEFAKADAARQPTPFAGYPQAFFHQGGFQVIAFPGVVAHVAPVIDVAVFQAEKF